MPEQIELGWQKADLYVSHKAQKLEAGLKKRLKKWFKPAQQPIVPELKEENPVAPQIWNFPEATLVCQDPLCREEQRIPVSVSAGAKEDGGEKSQRVVLSLRLGAIRKGKETTLPVKSEDWVVPLDVLARMTYGLNCLASGKGEEVPEKFRKAGFSVRWNCQDPATGKTFRVPEIGRLTTGFGQTPETFAQALADLSNYHMRLELGIQILTSHS